MIVFQPQIFDVYNQIALFSGSLVFIFSSFDQ